MQRGDRCRGDRAPRWRATTAAHRRSGQAPTSDPGSLWPVEQSVHRLHGVLSDANFKGAQALVTGGAGFVGSHIVEQLIDAGAARVVVIDDLTRGRLENLSSVAGNPALAFINGDICDAALIDRASAD